MRRRSRDNERRLLGLITRGRRSIRAVEVSLVSHDTGERVLKSLFELASSLTLLIETWVRVSRTWSLSGKWLSGSITLIDDTQSSRTRTKLDRDGRVNETVGFQGTSVSHKRGMSLILRKDGGHVRILKF